MNTMQYNEDADVEQIGHEYKDQKDWLVQNLAEQSSRKFVLMDHIYAGARV